MQDENPSIKFECGNCGKENHLPVDLIRAMVGDIADKVNDNE